MAIGGSDPLHTAATRRPDSPDMRPIHIPAWPGHHQFVANPCAQVASLGVLHVNYSFIWPESSDRASLGFLLKIRPQGATRCHKVAFRCDQYLELIAFTSSNVIHTYGHQHLQQNVVITNHQDSLLQSCHPLFLLILHFFSIRKSPPGSTSIPSRFYENEIRMPNECQLLVLQTPPVRLFGLC